jgi:thiol-disulfide isomerase/thioredoxin
MKERLIQFLKEDGLTIAVVLALAIAYIVLRTPGDDFDSLAALEARLTDGRPTVIELYSNTCSICLISKPRVDQLARDISPQADVLRLNVKDGVGRELAYHWQVAGVPTFFILDGQGEMVYRRAGAPEVERITEVVRQLDAVVN